MLELHQSDTKPRWEGQAVWVAMGKLVGKLLAGGGGGGGGGEGGTSTPSSPTATSLPSPSAMSFRVHQLSTQEQLAKSHPLVRHLTLSDDGFSDPPGIKVRARGGVEAVKCVLLWFVLGWLVWLGVYCSLVAAKILVGWRCLQIHFYLFCGTIPH